MQRKRLIPFQEREAADKYKIIIIIIINKYIERK
jgi:hypothetical protein